MNRRTFLQRSGGLAAVAGLAGCLDSAGSSPGPTDRDGNRTDETTVGDPTTDPESRFSGVRSDRDEPFRTISVGSRDDVAFPDNNRPRRVRVWNAADEVREIGLRISRDGEFVVEKSIEFAADAYLAVSLNEPANYLVAVGLADGTAEETRFEVSRSSFDCNSAGTDAGVMPDGRVRTMSASTAMGCPGAEITDTELSVGQGTCGEQHSASVVFENEAVRVDGAVRASTPDSDLALASANYDRETGGLTVRVRATGADETEAGVQCVGEIPYEATIEFDYDLPSEVVVVHESMDKTTEIERVDRKSD
jgi:hypothetical protein